MRNTLRAGFTLVEILIVVVILGILAAIVVPQFTNASNEAVKGALSSQLQTINSQVELYRVRNNGAAPTLPEAGGANDGWGDMVGGEYLKEVPINGYTGNGVVVADTDHLLGTRESEEGWSFDTATNTVFAMGFDGDFLAHETDDFNGGGGGGG